MRLPLKNFTLELNRSKNFIEVKKMKLHHLVKISTLTILASSLFFPLAAKAEINSAHNDSLIMASIEQGDVESGWADHYQNRADVNREWVDYHLEREQMEEALERQKAAAEAERLAEERREAAMEEYQNP